MSSLPKSVALNATSKFSVIDPSSLRVDHTATGDAPAAAGKGGKGRAGGGRAIKAGGKSVAETGNLIGGDFRAEKNPQFLQDRLAAFERAKAAREVERASLAKEPITIRLPDGREVAGTSNVTTPLDVAADAISPDFARGVVVARVIYAEGVVMNSQIAICDSTEDEEEDDDHNDGLWDATRPLVGDCQLTLLRFDDPGAKTVFWHSSSHVLGSALEREFGAKLTIGPPLDNGFYYDCYMGSRVVHESDYKDLEKQIKKICDKEKQPFERVEVTKEELLEMFAHNPFKVSLITNKIPDGGRTTVYRNGDFVDLCRGPHLPNTKFVKANKILSHSATNWLGDVNNDSLQRIYAVSFPDKARMKKHMEFLAAAKERDHRLIGFGQGLWFIHELSPGSTFFTGRGARIYNGLIAFIRKQYWLRGYDEVVSPNIFNVKLWEQSGHWQHYQENMFHFGVEGQEYGMKPMNCPGHCLMFGQKLRSYRDLPMRLADFGVLHRNEVSGSLTGLTRVRRFQQDDAHIFCRRDQMKQEVLAALDFMRYVYTIFGMTYRLELSTKPKKALGDAELWAEAEEQLAEALDEFVGAGNWHVNPGDGAFYGPKIDIKVYDALERAHQCATIQLDFQLPIRFDLRYKNSAKEMVHPVIVHRAMLGSVERCIAVLTEHWAGKWPFWISPRQVCVIPIAQDNIPYARAIGERLHAAGIHVDVDDSTERFQKKVRTAQIAQYNYQLVVGKDEEAASTANVRTRENQRVGQVALDEIQRILVDMKDNYTEGWPGLDAAGQENGAAPEPSA